MPLRIFEQRNWSGADPTSSVPIKLEPRLVPADAPAQHIYFVLVFVITVVLIVLPPFFLRDSKKRKKAARLRPLAKKSDKPPDVPAPIDSGMIADGDNLTCPQLTASSSTSTSSHHAESDADEGYQSCSSRPLPLETRQVGRGSDTLAPPPFLDNRSQSGSHLAPEWPQAGPSVSPSVQALVEDTSQRNQFSAQGNIHIHHGAVIHQGGSEPAPVKHNAEVFAWLEAPEQNHSHEDARGHYFDTTGQWLLDEDCYRNWKYRGDTQALHLTGTVGCGKTVLMSTVIDDILKYCGKQPVNTVRPAFFYFDARQRHQCEHLVRSLIRQLSASHELIPAALERLWGMSKVGKREISLSEWVACLRGIIQDSGLLCYIMLDALDECLDMPALERFLDQVGGWVQSGLPLRIMVSSRPLQRIDQMMSTVQPYPVPLNEAALRSDLTIYIRKRLERNLRWSEEQKEEVLNTLLKDANGWFRWVACQLDRVQQCRSNSELKEALQSLPPTLDGIYDQVLNNIQERDRVDASRVFQWLVYSKKPLTLTEMWEALAVNLEDWTAPFYDPRRRYMNEQDVLDLCPGFLTTIRRSRRDASGSDITATIVAFSHYSVQEYLLSEQVTLSPTLSAHFAMNDLVACDFLVRSCDLYLSHHGQPGQSIPGLCEGFDFRGVSDQHLQLVKRYPFVEHAAWVIRNHELGTDEIMEFRQAPFLAMAWRRIIKHFQDEQEQEDIWLAESGTILEESQEERGTHGLIFDRISAAVHAWVRPEWAFRDNEAETGYSMVPRLSHEDFWRSIYQRFRNDKQQSNVCHDNANTKQLKEAQLDALREHLTVIDALGEDEKYEVLLDFAAESGLDLDDIFSRAASKDLSGICG